ncbi:hypothetical protein ThimaDRAFT_1268 [Thiocapsa marina 5811]|uniref:Transposase IS4 family protein n=1 Tax=Thiocapsa marina 5811 TaxID=768671 RepID=F9U8L6_9GAMM|nr:hypothetical protein [Thiocapsa marina]EGV19124.1 hypothetical protein ThimaDRAFT_1268 [Thiocapsa marina 5811]
MPAAVAVAVAVAVRDDLAERFASCEIAIPLAVYLIVTVAESELSKPSPETHIELVPDASGQKAQAIHWQRHSIDGTMTTHPGVYCLRSNELTWGAEQLWRTNMMFTDPKAVFCSFKSELGLRPIFHHREERCEGHLFITVLAYQFVQLIRRHLHAQGINDSWAMIIRGNFVRCHPKCLPRSIAHPNSWALRSRQQTRMPPINWNRFQEP